MYFRRSLIILLICLLASGSAFSSRSKDPAPIQVFPIPPQSENSLFYIQRSKNTNAIVYDANIKADGTIEPTEPVKIYWIRYTTDSTTAPLTYIQEKFAYGLKSSPYPGKPGQYVMYFNSYDKKQFYLLKKADGKHFAAYTMINGRYSELKKIFIKINGGTFWFPNIEYIEITGIDIATQKPIVEHFKPAR